MKKQISIVVTVLCIVLIMSVAHAAQTLMEIGRSPFHQPPLTSVADLVAMVQDKSAEVEKGFVKAGRAELFQPFMAQISTVEIDTVQLPKGSKFEWMFYKRKGVGTVRVVKDITWGNEIPFTGFRFDIEKGENVYTFVVPLGCGNIAFVGESAIPVALVPPPVVPPAPEAAVPVVVAPISKTTVDTPGLSPIRFLVDVGYTHQFDPGHYLFGRVGLEYKITEDFSVLGLIGGAGHVDGFDGKTAFLADLLAEYSFSRFFIDLGIGAWLTGGDSDLKTENNQLDLIAAVGARVFGEEDAFNTSIFFEVRSAPDELNEIDEFGRFGVGLRMSF